MNISIKKLKFNNPLLEKEFLDDYYHKSLMTVRVALILGAVLYSIFGILDILIAPLSKTGILFIRFAVVTPGLLAALVLSFFDIFRKYMQPVLMAVTLMAGLGIVAMIGIAVEMEAGLYYYAGLMLVLMWAYTFVKLRFFYSVTVCWTIVLGYEITAVYFQEMLGNEVLLNRFINNNFFFISSNIIGMFAGYLMERYTRNDFLQRREIAEKSHELQVERNNLKDRITTMNGELELARKVQKKLIPSKAPRENISFLYKPMRAVGGDFMDFTEFRDRNKIGIFISDVSGHGLPAALITSIIKISIHEQRKNYSDPALMLLHLNNVLSSQTEDIFVTAFYGIYDINARSLTYSNAGHYPPLMLLNKSIKALEKSKSLPLATMSNLELIASGGVYTNSRAVLPVNSKILLYTDGLVEARKSNDNETDFNHIFKKRLVELEKTDCREFIKTLYGELVGFRGGESFDDDICIICVDII